jgi:hypothetical protein
MRFAVLATISVLAFCTWLVAQAFDLRLTGTAAVFTLAACFAVACYPRLSIST